MIERTHYSDENPSNCSNPTIFLSFDGTLHRGRGIMHAGVVYLDSRKEVFEFAPLLVELLSAYPDVDIVLATRWLQRLTFDEAVFCLPPELAWRVVGATSTSCSKLSCPHNVLGRRDVIEAYASSRRLKSWLVIGNETAYQPGYKYGCPVDHFLLLDPELGISDVNAYDYIRNWLGNVHQTEICYRCCMVSS